MPNEIPASQIGIEITPEEQAAYDLFAAAKSIYENGGKVSAEDMAKAEAAMKTFRSASPSTAAYQLYQAAESIRGEAFKKDGKIGAADIAAAEAAMQSLGAQTPIDAQASAPGAYWQGWLIRDPNTCLLYTSPSPRD